jgi:hypothetical protein
MASKAYRSHRPVPFSDDPIAVSQALLCDPRPDPLTENEDSNVRNYPYYLVLAVGAIALGSCGKAPPLTAAENQRVDQAMERVEAEQVRTDKVERQKRIAAAEQQKQRLIDAAPVIEVQGHPIAQENLGQHPPPNIQSPPSSGNRIADTSRTAN